MPLEVETRSLDDQAVGAASLYTVIIDRPLVLAAVGLA
jgi:hypothetical protein